jgi:hypothetical protein
MRVSNPIFFCKNLNTGISLMRIRIVPKGFIEHEQQRFVSLEFLLRFLSIKNEDAYPA